MPPFDILKSAMPRVLAVFTLCGKKNSPKTPLPQTKSSLSSEIAALKDPARILLIFWKFKSLMFSGILMLYYSA